MMECGLSLGTNLGDRLGNMAGAAERLAALAGMRVTARSHIYETEPVEVKAIYREMAYLNAVVVVEWQGDLSALSAAVHGVEAVMGRVRGEDRNAPRPIDIDILYADDVMLDDDDLTLPHPRWSERRFVVQPLADVRPSLCIPGQNRTVAAILAALPEVPTVHLFEPWPAGRGPVG
jgi:2-amino-4-hydroxy-6-hydroxymethyldihydropteridine diphosphokinase